MALGSQFLLLLWKNWTLQKRKVCVTIFEILLPLFFGIILVLIRLLVKTTDYPNDTVWQTSNFTSDGLDNIHFSQRPEILFVPNTTVIRNVMTNVKSSINSQNVAYNKTLKGKYVKIYIYYKIIKKITKLPIDNVCY